MKPQIKALIALPFAVTAIALVLIFLATHTTLVTWVFLSVCGLLFLGALWYSLYVFFGGDPQ